MRTWPPGSPTFRKSIGCIAPTAPSIRWTNCRVTKALRYGQTCTANDVVVHRSDGRRVPLFTWAAPIDLGKVGRPEAAVWILEDLTALQQAEFARRESEARLRAVFETLAEGVIVQNRAGVVIEGNPSAATHPGDDARKARRPFVAGSRPRLPSRRRHAAAQPTSNPIASRFKSRCRSGTLLSACLAIRAISAGCSSIRCRFRWAQRSRQTRRGAARHDLRRHFRGAPGAARHLGGEG